MSTQLVEEVDAEEVDDDVVHIVCLRCYPPPLIQYDFVVSFCELAFAPSEELILPEEISDNDCLQCIVALPVHHIEKHQGFRSQS